MMARQSKADLEGVEEFLPGARPRSVHPVQAAAGDRVRRASPGMKVPLQAACGSRPPIDVIRV